MVFFMHPDPWNPKTWLAPFKGLKYDAGHASHVSAERMSSELALLKADSEASGKQLLHASHLNGTWSFHTCNKVFWGLLQANFIFS